ncbi:MAG: hypothetical protein ABI828_07840 [Actinomycetota bacterium]
MGHKQPRSPILLSRIRSFSTIAILAAVVLFVVGCHSGSNAPSTISCPASDPLRGVYSPGRLTVLGKCQWFYGVVTVVDTRSDGDHHILLKPDPKSAAMLNVDNVNAGGMIVEIVPGQTLPYPKVGDHIAVLGTFVLDTHNNWNEIHPVWAIKDLTTGVLNQGLPPVPPEYHGGSND